MKKIRFSIIMPCYNSAEYVEKAIKSVINQTYPYWELVAINDGSKDNTLDILNRYAANDVRIKVFSKENGGYATAVNYGLDKITGDYFLFLGSDDYLDVRLFEKLSDYINEYTFTPDMVAFRTRLVDKNAAVGIIEKYTRFDKPLYSNCSLKEFVENNPTYAAIFSIRDTSRCYKTELLGETRYFGETGIDSDGIFSMLLCHKAKSFLNIPVDGYYWYVRNDSVSSSISLKKHIDRISNWHSFFEIIYDLYEKEITSTEKEYLVFLSHFIVELAMKPKLAIKYRRFIRNEAKFAIKVAEKFDVILLKYIHIVAKCPVVFSLIYSTYSRMRK